MHRSFVHLELNTADTDTAKSFYRQVFQWDFQEIPMPDGTQYTQIRPPSGPGGGMQQVSSNGRTAWMPYVGVESVEDTVARVVAAGGNVVEPYQPVPGFGALAIVEDPNGARFGLWETAMPIPVGDPDPGDPPASSDGIEVSQEDTSQTQRPRAKKAAKAKRPAPPKKNLEAEQPAAPKKAAKAKRPAPPKKTSKQGQAAAVEQAAKVERPAAGKKAASPKKAKTVSGQKARKKSAKGRASGSTKKSAGKKK